MTRGSEVSYGQAAGNLHPCLHRCDDHEVVSEMYVPRVCAWCVGPALRHSSPARPSGRCRRPLGQRALWIVRRRRQCIQTSREDADHDHDEDDVEDAAAEHRLIAIRWTLRLGTLYCLSNRRRCSDIDKCCCDIPRQNGRFSNHCDRCFTGPGLENTYVHSFSYACMFVQDNVRHRIKS